MKRLAYLLLTCATLSLGTTACSKSADPQAAPSSGPKEYQVEYRISSTEPAADYVAYANETGANTTLGTTALPKNFTFKRTMKRGDNLNLSASTGTGTAATEVTTAILLDGKEVKKTTARGSGALAVAVFVVE